ncbi:Bro-N domain-containing protein [Bryobacter aggregatus]|uniref:BRO-N domain-containing protein n=1 Tax=Bryobacter aggregatus TaxID=360054 RepID=UPI00192E3651|nr:Bro-N domain-containing protein [Bryobacter aggregatus]
MADKPIDISSLLPEDTPIEEIRRRAAKDMGPLGKDNGAAVEQGDAQLVLFEGITIRKVFHENEWHFAIVDIIAALSESDRPSKYWSDLKAKLVKNEGFTELSAKIGQLKMASTDGKFYLTDAVTVETALRIIQSIPSRKAEPFKRWLATVGYERIQEYQDPEIAVKRAILLWQAQGRTSDWIEARLRCIVVRRELTDQWQKGGITGREYGRLTNIIAKKNLRS